MLSQNQKRQLNFSLGQRGEAKAAKFLTNKNYQILDINIRIKNNEVDIIALDKSYDEVVFIEVKTRNTDFYGNPSSAVNNKKIASMNMVACAYLRDKRLQKDYRFDIITVTPAGVEHFENISWL